MAAATQLLVVGAHPDDAERFAGGLAAKYVEAGREVTFVSMTNGDAGHHELERAEIEARRRAEAEAAAATLGVEYEIRDTPDGELEPTLAARKDVIRLIRRVDPDLLVTHRPNDYHPDHRYTSTLVQDAAYMVRVPRICPDTEPLDADPVIAYLEDGFEKPAPFEPDVVVDIDDVVETKLDAVHCHASQFYEWLPHVTGHEDEVPKGEAERRAWLRERYGEDSVETADDYRDALLARYGDAGADVTYAEAFELCEYGTQPTAEQLDALFPE